MPGSSGEAERLSVCLGVGEDLGGYVWMYGCMDVCNVCNVRNGPWVGEWEWIGK